MPAFADLRPGRPPRPDRSLVRVVPLPRSRPRPRRAAYVDRRPWGGLVSLALVAGCIASVGLPAPAARAQERVNPATSPPRPDLSEETGGELPEEREAIEVEAEQVRPPGLEATEEEEAGGPAYRVTRFELSWLQEHEGLPDISKFQHTEVVLGVQDDVYTSAGPDRPQVRFRLDFVPPTGPSVFDASALISINQQLVTAFSNAGLGGMIVAPDVEDISFTTGEDLRPPTRTALRLTVFLPTVRELQSFASGERIPEEEATNNPLHARILEDSPVQAGDLFRPIEVDEYVARLNRQPGRRVVAQVSPSRDMQQLYLDYQIAEAKPWLVYAQMANTGTKSTGSWQSRIGFVDLQLTNRDDILGLDAVLNTSTDVYSISGTYEWPLFVDELRLRAETQWSQYRAEDDFGFEQNARFKGKQAHAVLQARYNVYQYHEFFVDLLAGLAFNWIETRNLTDHSDIIIGRDPFLNPQLGIGLERRDPDLFSKFTGQVWAEMSTLNHRTTDPNSGYNSLGRTDPSGNWAILLWDFDFSFYVEPLILGTEDPSMTLAHEFVMRYQGQSAWDKYRLIPHFQQIAGGMETVRGYRQGIIAGDTVHIGSIEYRLHIPRLFRPDPNPPTLPGLGEFAFAPRQAGDRPDWDLVFKTFFDVGRVEQSDRLELTESNDTIDGVGLGLDFFFKRNVAIRFDYAWGLGHARCQGGRTEGGSCDIKADGREAHFEATVFF